MKNPSKNNLDLMADRIVYHVNAARGYHKRIFTEPEMKETLEFGVRTHMERARAWKDTIPRMEYIHSQLYEIKMGKVIASQAELEELYPNLIERILTAEFLRN